MEKNLNILIIEANPLVAAGYEKRLSRLGFNVSCKATPDTPVEELGAMGPDMAILGPSSDPATSLECIHKLRIIDPVMPILTPFDDGCISKGVTFGPFDGVHYLNPDLDPDEVSKIIGIALEHCAECRLLPDFPVIIGQSRAIIDIRQKIHNVAAKDITVFITGETGTGKEQIARSIHYHSQRCKNPLVKINCGALPDELLESEVFGFQRGAFTDAHKDKPGRLEMADGGTLFIDEIGDLSLPLQVKFLQVLEDRAFTRLGGTEDKIIDIRVVAATNTDLRERVREGSFRKDLFYRLNVVSIEALPLREKKEDIPLLLHYFLNKYCFEFKKEMLRIPNKIVRLFSAYQWPGNVRELENVIRRAIALRDWNFAYKELNLENPDQEMEDASSAKVEQTHPDWDDEEVKRRLNDKNFSLKEVSKAYVSRAERQAILKTLKATQWNRKKAAELLRVSYKTLLNRIDEFGLEP